MLPDFASNGGGDGLRVADQINMLAEALSENKVKAPPLSIATAYLNAAGFHLLEKALTAAPHVRLLLGAEPDEATVEAIAPPPDADRDEKLDQALATHDAWVRMERDNTGFAREEDAQARALVRWLTTTDESGTPRVEVRRYTQGFLHGKAYIVDDPVTPAALAGSSNMTYAGLAHNAELNLGTGGGTHAAGKVQEWFEDYWSQAEPYDLAALYNDRWEPHTPWQIFLRMLWELYQQHLDEERTAATMLRLTPFQADGVARMKRLLDELGGVLVADEVGLGKTYLAAEVIKEANEVNRQRVLIIAPAALKTSMWEPFLTKHGISRLTQVHSYDEVRLHLSEDDPIGRDRFLQEMRDYAMVVVDEAHNLRNASTARAHAVDEVIVDGKNPKKVVLLTATPVNNSLTDLEVLIRYFVRDDARFTAVGIPSIHKYIRAAQAMDPEDLTPEHLFDLMDQVAVRRTRRFIREHYPRVMIEGPGGEQAPLRFPDPDVYRVDYDLTEAGIDLVDSVIYALTPADDDDDPRNDADDPDRLKLARYTPSAYLTQGDIEAYQVSNAGLLRSALLKRLESSPQALLKTLETLIGAHSTFLNALEGGYVLTGEALREWASSETDDLDQFVRELGDSADLAAPARDFDGVALRKDVDSDLQLLKHLRDKATRVVGESEPKVAALVERLEQIAAAARSTDPNGISHGDRRKVIVFSTYSDTILAIHEQVSKAINSAPPGSPLADYRGRIAPPIMGAYASTKRAGESGGVDQGGRASIIEGFAPKTAARHDSDGKPLATDQYDILLTTDVLAEGVNLQQAGHIVNYDLPWNPMKIVQRNGRIDRIGSQYRRVHLGVFFPAERLDAMLGLEITLQRKLAQASAAVGTGEVLPGWGRTQEVILTDPDRMVGSGTDVLVAPGAPSSDFSYS